MCWAIQRWACQEALAGAHPLGDLHSFWGEMWHHKLLSCGRLGSMHLCLS